MLCNRLIKDARRNPEQIPDITEKDIQELMLLAGNTALKEHDGYTAVNIFMELNDRTNLKRAIDLCYEPNGDILEGFVGSRFLCDDERLRKGIERCIEEGYKD